VTEPRRFPLPWEVHEGTKNFCIRDAKGQAIAYIYYDDPRAGDLTRDEARRIAIKIAKLPELLQQPRERLNE